MFFISSSSALFFEREKALLDHSILDFRIALLVSRFFWTMMKPFVPLTTILALLASAATMLALATPLQACSSTSITPCGCPDGTEYAQSVTFATIGAKATDVRALIGDCSSSDISLTLSVSVSLSVSLFLSLYLKFFFAVKRTDCRR